ncbi:MAG: hypothetical protein JXR94_06700 [Candidatus Hydrogenedentes bacterium]|nr:hypothetical protein [Candidatus Hydrogenedentota bacterium]
MTAAIWLLAPLLLVPSSHLSELEELWCRESDVDLSSPRIGEADRAMIQYWMELRQAGAREMAHDVVCKLAASTSLPEAVTTYFLMKKAGEEMGLGRPRDAFSTMETLRRRHPENKEVRLKCDLEAARFMAQTAGVAQGFNPSLAAKERHFEQLFSTYAPHQYDIIEAHFEYARLLIREADSAPSYE